MSYADYIIYRRMLLQTFTAGAVGCKRLQTDRTTKSGWLTKTMVTA